MEIILIFCLLPMELGRLWCHIKSSPLSAPFLDFLVGSILRLWGVFYRKLWWQALWNYTLLNCRFLLPPSRVLHTCHLSSFKDEARGVWVPGQPGSCMKTLHQNTSHNNSNKTSGFSWNVCKRNPSVSWRRKLARYICVSIYIDAWSPNPLCLSC